MQTTKSTKDRIKKYEGCRLTAYRCPAGVLTIGYGHTAGVKEGQKITQAEADALFEQDIKTHENYVFATGLTLTQGQMDALVSFSFNCGPGNLAKLVKGRTHKQIADAIPLYNKGGGKVLPGLVKRRQWEHDLFVSDMQPETDQKKPETKQINPYPVPDKNLKRGSKGVTVRWLQRELIKRGYEIVCDGDFGPITERCVKDFQLQHGHGLKVDGIVGPQTRAALLT